VRPAKHTDADIKKLIASVKEMQKNNNDTVRNPKFITLGDMVMSIDEFNVRFNNAPESKAYTGDKKWNEVIEDGRIKIQINVDEPSFGSYIDYTNELLDKVMQDYKEKTAIDFVKCGNVKNEKQQPDCGSGDHKTWMTLSARPTNGLTGCSSYVGRWGDTTWRGTGAQGISLGQGCLYMHTMIHEIMHALGWTHEQNRPDRDDFVTIQWDNISPQMKSNFNAEKGGKIFGTKYDPMSVMQYSSSAFSINGRPTIVSKPGTKDIPTDKVYWSQKHINKGMTDDDAFEINNVYTLAKWCEGNGEEWVYGNGETCDGSGNCIKKGERVENGSTCKSKGGRSDLTTTESASEGTTTDDDSSDADTSTAVFTTTAEVSTTEETTEETKDQEEGKDWAKSAGKFVQFIIKVLEIFLGDGDNQNRG